MEFICIVREECVETHKRPFLGNQNGFVSENILSTGTDASGREGAYSAKR
jgi:hypothetical protein